MYVAIQLQPILLGNDRIAFRPIGMIKGDYSKKNDIFVDEFGYEYTNMTGNCIYDDRYFCCPTTLQELIDVYDSEDENYLLEEFLDSFMDRCYVGFYDLVTGTIKLIEIDFNKIENSFFGKDDEKNNVSETIEYKPDEEEKFVFDIKSLKDLRDKKSIEEVRDFIDKLLSVNDYVKENYNESTEIKTSDPLKKEGSRKIALKKEESSKFNLKDMRDFVFSEIIAQDEAVKRITTCIMSNLDSSNPKRKSHLLLTGPTGTGKSKTIQLICEYLDIPYTKVDSTDYTQTGYVGRSVDEMLQRLIYAANGDVEKAQKGILVIDEIDKKASKDEKGDASTKAVMDSLLKITGRGIVQVDLIEDKSKTTIDFDTSNLTVIFTGAFEGIENIENNTGCKTVGFVKEEEKTKEENRNMPKLLIKYGMTPELIGRIKCIVPLKSFEEKDYVQILKYSKSSPLLIEKEYYEKDKGIKFTYTSNCVIELARQAKELNVGARGLETVVSKMLEDVQERVLNREHIKTLKLTKKTVLNNKEYYVEY